MIIKIILIIVAISILLFFVAFVNALFIKNKRISPKSAKNYEKLLPKQKIAENLSQLIQIKTVSRRDVCDNTNIYVFHKKIEELYPHLHKTLEKTDIDGALLFRWKGSNPSLKPILLMSHMDVVEAHDNGEWKYPAFDGKIADDKVWGRGTIDTKGALCSILESVEYLVKEGFTPPQDVYIASSNNEEVTGDGAVKTVEYLYQKGITFDLVMDEGGAVVKTTMLGINTNLAMVGIVEKGRANVRFTATSKGGHASIPMRNSPISRLAEFINYIEKKNPFKKKFTKPVLEMYKAMAPYMSFKYRFILGNLWLFAPILKLILPKLGGQANALISSTCVFTMAQGSDGANVIPQKATATANMRFMLHEGMGKTLLKMQKISKRYNLDMEVISGYDCCNPADTTSYAYKKVIEQIDENFGVPIIPYVMLAGTDARHYTKICDCVLRFVPIKMTEDQQHSAHAVNENIDVSSLVSAVGFYIEFIKNYNKQ